MNAYGRTFPASQRNASKKSCIMRCSSIQYCISTKLVLINSQWHGACGGPGTLFKPRPCYSLFNIQCWVSYCMSLHLCFIHTPLDYSWCQCFGPCRLVPWPWHRQWPLHLNSVMITSSLSTRMNDGNRLPNDSWIGISFKAKPPFFFWNSYSIADQLPTSSIAPNPTIYPTSGFASAAAKRVEPCRLLFALLVFVTIFFLPLDINF